MKKCADCDADNPDDAMTCRVCHRGSFIRPKPKPSNDALRKIKIAWIAGVISASIGLIVSLLPLFGMSVGGYTMAGIWLNTLHALLMGALAFGVASKSRVCAVVLFGWFLREGRSFFTAWFLSEWRLDWPDISLLLPSRHHRHI